MVRLFHAELGGAGKPPLIILHGLLGSSRNWRGTGRMLARHHHVLALDARNHGKSPHAPEMNYEVMMEDLLAWMDTQGLARATLVGHSMGGKTAMLLACRHPGRVERLVIVDIAPKDYRGMIHRAEFLAMNELELGSLHSYVEAERRFEARVPDPDIRKFLVTNLARDEHGHDRWHWIINLPVLTWALPELEKNCLCPADRFSGPTLFVVGGCSHYVAGGDHALVQRHFPGVRIEVIAGSGHNPHMDRPEEFIRLLTAFVREPVAGAAAGSSLRPQPQ